MVTPSYMLAIATNSSARVSIRPRRRCVSASSAPSVDARDAPGDREAHEYLGRRYLWPVRGDGPGVANECAETKDGPTIWEDHFYPEIIDPDTGEVLPDGEFGELVFTSLTKEAMPVVRYRTRDLTRLLPGTARPAFRRMEKVTGRTDDMMIVRGVNVFPSQIEELILKRPELAPHYQCVLTREADGYADGARGMRPRRRAGDVEAARDALAHDIKAYIGVSAGIEVLPTGGIERSVGKARRIVDLRPR